MGIALLDLPEVKEGMKQRLMNNWILVTGHNEGINNLEQQIYTPGTKKNGDFELIMIPGIPIIAVFLAKKTEDLREFFNLQLTDEEYELLLGLEFYKLSDKLFPVECLFIKKGYDKESKIDTIITSLFRGRDK